MKRLTAILTWPVRFAAAIALQPDKIAHFYWGGCMGFAGGLWAGWWALTVVAAAAAAKELYDLRHPPHQCEGWDFAATVLGGACAVAVLLLHARFP